MNFLIDRTRQWKCTREKICIRARREGGGEGGHVLGSRSFTPPSLLPTSTSTPAMATTDCTQLLQNSDVSGIGVRISFYLQSLFLGEQLLAHGHCPPWFSTDRLSALLSARSGEVDDVSGALQILVTTNVAYVIASFVSGFSSQPQITYQECVFFPPSLLPSFFSFGSIWTDDRRL